MQECIVAHPSDARGGVSRPTIKKVSALTLISSSDLRLTFPSKFIESKYHIEVDAANASHLNRAITTGSKKGIFTLPKGACRLIKRVWGP
jgi:hypothetical protein